MLCQSRVMRIKSHVGWAATLSSRSRNRKYWVWILLLNQRTTDYNERHPLPIRLASPSSFMGWGFGYWGALSNTITRGQGRRHRNTGRVPFTLPLPPQAARTVTRHHGFTCLTFTTSLVKGMSFTFLVNKEKQRKQRLHNLHRNWQDGNKNSVQLCVTARPLNEHNCKSNLKSHSVHCLCMVQFNPQKFRVSEQTVSQKH